MYPSHPTAFEFERPESLDEAIRLLSNGEDTKVIAGGHSLLPAMKLHLTAPALLVDIGRIAGLDGIERNDDGLTIGALATHATVAASETVRSACPVLAEMAGLIGDRQVRNRGTIGGSLAHADPGADYPTVVTALEATIVAVGLDGEREIPAGDFFTGVFDTALRSGELVTQVRIPLAASGTGASYRKHHHPASGYAVVGAAAVVGVDGGTCSRARLVIGGATGAPVVVPVEGLVGQPPSEDAIAAATAGVGAALGEPLSDTYASADYRRHLAGVLARRALAVAASRAGSATEEARTR
jgi:carbon-monoxide dehydrogenase medium subunit